jgi:hypothetical protein
MFPAERAREGLDPARGPLTRRHCVAMTETFFIAETFHSHGVIFFRIEKSFQDLLAG